ncbi:hypothetical protein DFH07DRAFT_768028 [Mycena maculata]|uniref:SET domain-containing protein n=1 Tax=Mycena maculata TaxID=230809 RepID=A0AAD7JVP2_9AGAR|nr:hypothetical protein DFH07DRAFT_768028 [Mycena maculata]
MLFSFNPLLLPWQIVLLLILLLLPLLFRMKRGFLNSSKAKTRPLGPTLAKTPKLINPNAPDKIDKFPIGKRNVEVPKGYDSNLKIKECDPHGGSTPNAMTFTSVPINADDDQPITECFFFPGSKEVLMKMGRGFPKPLRQPAKPAFRLNEKPGMLGSLTSSFLFNFFPGMGMGLFATRALKTGDLILSDRPLYVGARGVGVAYPPSLTWEQYQQLALNELEKCVKVSVMRMRPEAKEAFMALKNSHKEDGSGPIVGIIRTNALSVDGLRPGVKDETKSYSAVCKDISRLNHSCSPNTQPCWNLPSFSFELFAVRDIAAGEELTFQYVDVECSAAARNKALKPYDFVCTCAACKDPKSDARRAAIRSLGAPTVYTWVFNMMSPDDFVSAQCRRQLALIAREGLEHLTVYYDLMESMLENYITLGDAQEASEWAVKMDKCTWVDKPVDVKALLDPTSSAYQKHPLWRKRADGPRARDLQGKMQELAALANRDGIIRPYAMLMM